jgi:hypothetical protein
MLVMFLPIQDANGVCLAGFETVFVLIRSILNLSLTYTQTALSVHYFILAMAMYPEVQKKAQSQLDRVLVDGRLPELSDRPSLPWVDAIIKETLRWSSMTPVSLAHSTSSHDMLQDKYFIPEGTIVMANVWWAPIRNLCDTLIKIP